jgi:hypothetical protein
MVGGAKVVGTGRISKFITRNFAARVVPTQRIPAHLLQITRAVAGSHIEGSIEGGVESARSNEVVTTVPAP